MADPAFPRSTGYWWLGCKTASAGTVSGKGRQVENSQPLDEDSDVTDLIKDGGEIVRDAYKH